MPLALPAGSGWNSTTDTRIGSARVIRAASVSGTPFARARFSTSAPSSRLARSSTGCTSRTVNETAVAPVRGLVRISTTGAAPTPVGCSRAVTRVLKSAGITMAAYAFPADSTDSAVAASVARRLT
nr:hypothetical protein [Nocardia otitidiscaviarum]